MGRYQVNVNSVGFGLIDTRLIQPIDKTAPPTIEMAGRQIQWAHRRRFSCREGCVTAGPKPARPRKLPALSCSSVRRYPTTSRAKF